MPQIEKSIPASKAASTAPAACCRACRTPEHWWHSYREVLLSTETLASLAGFVLLATGWVG